MTREEITEAIQYIEKLKASDPVDENKKVFDTVIKSLNTMISEDTISRKSTLEEFYAYVADGFAGSLEDRALSIYERLVENTPSLYPKVPIGKWIEVGYNLSDNWIFTGYKCSECGNMALETKYNDHFRTKYCPYCGVKMKLEED